MEQLQKLVTTLSSLKSVSIKIISDMMPIMDDIVKSGEIFNEVLHRSKLEKDEVQSYLQDMTSDMVEDAEVILKEIDLFAKAAEKGRKKIKETIDLYPFLANVWYGDTYDDVVGVEALNMLLNGLNETLKTVDEDYIIETAIKELTKNHNR